MAIHGNRWRILVLVVVVLSVAAGLAFVVSAWATARQIRDRAIGIAGGGGVTAAQLPEEWIDWLLLAEDPAFRTHNGVDVSSPGAGWTTMTQGLVKIHYVGPSHGLVGKPVQTVRALVLDRVLTKDQQLTLFLNTAYFGSSADGEQLHGFRAAANEIYGKELDVLNDEEFIGLVAMLIGPNQFHPIHHPQRHAERVRRIRSLIDGRCVPASWRDVYLEGCDPVGN